MQLEVVKNNWAVDEVKTRVRAFNVVALVSADESAPAQTGELLTLRLGRPGLHPIVDRGAPEVHLGFKFYPELSPIFHLRQRFDTRAG